MFMNWLEKDMWLAQFIGKIPGPMGNKILWMLRERVTVKEV